MSRMHKRYMVWIIIAHGMSKQYSKPFQNDSKHQGSGSSELTTMRDWSLLSNRVYQSECLLVIVTSWCTYWRQQRDSVHLVQKMQSCKPEVP
jgi:hypothetical protein